MLEPVIQDKRRWWSREDVILLVLLGALYFFPGLGQIPLFDRDEPRFATAARTMDYSHNFIVPMFNGNLRPDKPPLIYWLMNGAATLVGGWNEFAVRLPSAICGTLTLVVVYFMVGLRFGRVTGLIAAMMLGSSVLCMFMSHMATADATMLFFIVACMACVWQAWDASGGGKEYRQHVAGSPYLLDRGETGGGVLDQLPVAPKRRMSAGLALLFWIALAAGVMTKGVPLFFVFIPMIALSLGTGALPYELKQWRSHLHVTGRRIFLAILVAGIAAALILTTFKSSNSEIGMWAGVLGILLLAMILTPGLPSLLVRCIWRGNWGWWRQFRFIWGLPLLIILVGWWVVLAGEQTHWALINDMVGTHFLVRVAGPLLKMLHIHIVDSRNTMGADPLGSYGQPPGFYLLLVWVTFWPWSVLLVPAAYHTFRRIRGKTPIALDPRPYQFLVAWVVPMWILLELARGKLLHYPLPLYVGLAVLCADTVVQSWHRLTDVLAAKWFEMMRWGTLAIWIGLAVVSVAGVHYLEPDLTWRCVPLAGLFAAAGVAGASAWGRPSWPFVTVLGWGAALLYANAVVLPEMNALQVSRLAGDRVREMLKQYPDAHLAAVGYQEGTLVWYANHDIEMIPSLDEMQKKVPFAPERLPAADEKYILVVDKTTVDTLEKKHAIYGGSPRITGLDSGNYKPVTIWVITNAPPSTTTSAPATTR